MNRKKLLIVNDNMNIGGIQKSLVNLINSISDEYDISLILFSKIGPLLDEIPNNVKILKVSYFYNILGMQKKQLKKRPLLFILKSFFVVMLHFFSKKNIISVIGLFQKKITGFDAVISYSHPTSEKMLQNGSVEFVLNKTLSDNKICFIHCDYLNANIASDYTNSLIKEFNKIACCSNSVKDRFLEVLPYMKDKTYVVRNFFNSNIIEKAKCAGNLYDNKKINLVVVARLSSEKGINRIIDSISKANRNDLLLHIVGDGPQKNQLILMAKELNVSNYVHFLGETDNPYPYMFYADYLIVPSYHEAAPIVFDEAITLGLYIISSNTTSAYEIIESKYGTIFNNDDELVEILKKMKKKTKNKFSIVDNEKNKKTFGELL